MELGKYIRLKKDFINSEIMELAAESALLRLIRQTGKNTEELCESDQDNSSFHYKEEYQGLFDKYYDEAYDRIAGLIKFDVAQDDVVEQKGNTKRPPQSAGLIKSVKIGTTSVACFQPGGIHIYRRQIVQCRKIVPHLCVITPQKLVGCSGHVDIEGFALGTFVVKELVDWLILR